jgi:hypothetical protein
MQARLRNQSIALGISDTGKSDSMNANVDSSTSKGINFEDWIMIGVSMGFWKWCLSRMEVLLIGEINLYRNGRKM